MIRGGYKIIDLKNKPLEDSVGMVYEGIYDAIEECQKPIVLSGLNFGGTEYKDLWAQFTLAGGNYEFKFTDAARNDINIVVEDTDVVIVTIL